MLKKTLLSLAITATVVGIAGCNVSSTDKYDNKISNSGVEYAQASSVYPIFAPEIGQVPLAIDLLFAGTTDGTANTADTTPPVTTALNKLDGFSTVAPLYIEFSSELDPATVVAGQSVFLVKLRNAKDDSTIDALDIDTILASNPSNPFSPIPIMPTDYEARAIDMNGTPAIQVLLKKPLEAKTKYLVIVTDAVQGKNGDAAGQSATYAHAIGSDALMNSALAPLRPALQGWQQLAQGFLASGSALTTNAKGKVVFNYAFTTGGTTDVLHAMAAPGTFLAAAVSAQITSIAIGEGAITQAVIGGGGNQAAADAQLDAIAGMVAVQINTATPGTLPTTDGATIRPTLKSTAALQPYYLAGLQKAITTSKGAPVIAAIDAPQSRTYSPIISAANTPVAVPYDTFLTAQITQKVTAQITSIAVGEGAITQAQGVNAETALNAIALQTANAINTAAGSTVVPTTNGGADARAAFKAENSPFADNYLTGLRTTITTSQVTSLSSQGNIYQGGLTIPSYLPDSAAGTADAALGTWVASDAAAQALGLPGAPRDADGVSANVTYRFPFANKLADKTIPVMVTLPNATSCAKPAEGYPVAIYQHGITVDRTAGVLVGNALAKACVAMVAIDHVMHGVAPNTATGLVFSTEVVAASNPAQASPFAAVRAQILLSDANNWMKDLHERHNNVGKNAAQQNVAMTFAAAGATNVGASGDLCINLQNFARTRDAMRQTVLDMLNLSASIKTMDIDASGDLSVDPITGVVTNPDLDASKVYFIGHSLGGIIGTTFVAVNNDPAVRTYNSNLPKIQAAILGNPGGGVVKLLENSPSIGGAKILPGLQAAAGLTQGSVNIEKFFGVMQAMVDSADPINFASSAGIQATPVLVYEAVGGVDGAKPDLVVPNNALNATVATAKSYLAGTDALVTQLGITTKVNSATTGATLGNNKEYFPEMNNDSTVRAVVRMGAGDHSTFSNAEPQAAFVEIFQQVGSFFNGVPSAGTTGKGFVIEKKTVLEQAQ